MERTRHVIGVVTVVLAFSSAPALGVGGGAKHGAAGPTKQQIKKVTDDLRAYYRGSEPSATSIDAAVTCVENVMAGPPVGIAALLDACVAHLREPVLDKRPKTIAELTEKYGAAAVKAYYACSVAGTGFFEETKCLRALKHPATKGT